MSVAEVSTAHLSLEAQPVRQEIPSITATHLLKAISPDDLKQFMKSLPVADKHLVQGLAPTNPDRDRVILHLAAFYGDRRILKATKLVAKEPPENVHAMARGKLSSGGSFYYADLILHVLAQAGISLPQRARVLDFGASSGRVARVLKLYWTDAVIEGCDPNEAAIQWARDNVPGVTFFVNPFLPPLPVKDRVYHLVYGISIWSHFGERANIQWFAEMHRVLKPGGFLLFTFHGFNSIHHYATRGMHELASMDETEHTLLRQGFSFADIFGTAGDWGVVDADWGEAYFTLEWLLSRLTPDWILRYYRPGAAEGNQDIVILQAR